MIKVYIIGRGFLGEHLCKYFSEKHSDKKVIYFTDDFAFKIIDRINYRIMDIKDFPKEDTIDIMINTISDVEFIQSFKNLSIKQYHQITEKRNKKIESIIGSYFSNVTFSLPCQLYGPGQSYKESLPLWIFDILNDKKLEIKKNYERNWLFITDYCEAIDLILQKKEPVQFYKISTNIKISDTELIKMIIKKLNKEENLLIIRSDESYDQTIECSEIKELGWEPKHAFDKALLLTLKWYFLDVLGEKMKNVIQLTSKKH